jgi:hypothetical protein
LPSRLGWHTKTAFPGNRLPHAARRMPVAHGGRAWDNGSMNYRWLAVPAFILAAPFIVPPPALADTPMTALRVEVKTLGDRPIDRASVVVRFVQGRSKIKLGRKIMTTWEIRTNQEGVAKIPPIPQGKIQVQVIAKGFQTYGEFIEVNEPEKTVEVKMAPPQQQYSSHQ